MDNLLIAVTLQTIKDYKHALDRKRSFPIRKEYSKQEMKKLKYINYTIIECEEYLRGENKWVRK